jgi:hypothetical protein
LYTKTKSLLPPSYKGRYSPLWKRVGGGQASVIKYSQKRSIQAAILNGLRDLTSGDIFGDLQGGKGAKDFSEDRSVGAGEELEF